MYNAVYTLYKYTVILYKLVPRDSTHFYTKSKLA